MQEAIWWQLERFTSAEPISHHCEVDPPLEGKQCSHKFWHMQGVRILFIKFITSEFNLLLLRKLITFKEIMYNIQIVQDTGV